MSAVKDMFADAARTQVDWLDFTQRVRFQGDSVDACTAFGMDLPRCRWVLQAGGTGVNCAALENYIPHTCGTHTETVFHITHHRYMRQIVHQLPPPLGFFEAQVIPCRAEIVHSPSSSIAEWASYPSLEENDLVVGATEIARAIQALPSQNDTVEAVLLFVTGPDGATDWSDGAIDRPPYVTPAAITTLTNRFPRMQHLLTNLPSVDRRADGGLVCSHRAFFAPDMTDDQSPCQYVRRTLTELLRAPRNWPWPNGIEGIVCIAMAPIEGLDAIPSSVYFRARKPANS
ncbi:hypothetical protein F1559_001678 [Cyanidiococcus yangmingshanensis]|uniref:Uncharacterized protein n=1 Tax=Cyanidiococcus yangmingshanensis TaxID=2690220 RepID=A0A7J7ILV9_9RHOD|nr:hypothetical protein F1559_001678 [Cyanidiococcus yangmingshanensis]